MKLVKAKLVKRITDDGCFEVFDSVPLGKEYQVDLDSRRMATGYNVVLGKFWERELINVEQSDLRLMPFPLELLEIEDSQKGG